MNLEYKTLMRCPTKGEEGLGENHAVTLCAPDPIGYDKEAAILIERFDDNGAGDGWESIAAVSLTVSELRVLSKNVQHLLWLMENTDE